MSGFALFVAGTDTGAGKTQVARALCAGLRRHGLNVGVFKPAETGCADPAQAADALALIEASGCAEPLERVCPYRLREPLAPAVAAAREGVTVDLGVLDRALAALRQDYDVVVCEGAGGLLVPLAEGVLNADWLESRKLPVLLVGRLGLGTINHTLLSARYLASRGVPLLGTVLSETEPATTVAEETNPAILARYPEAKLLGVLRHGAAELPAGAVDAVVGEAKGADAPF